MARQLFHACRGEKEWKNAAFRQDSAVSAGTGSRIVHRGRRGDAVQTIICPELSLCRMWVQVCEAFDLVDGRQGILGKPGKMLLKITVPGTGLLQGNLRGWK